MTTAEGADSPVRRTIPRLQMAAAKVAVDLVGSLGDGWTCQVSTNYVLTVAGPKFSADVLLPEHVEDQGWFVPHGAESADAEAALAHEAEETVAREAATLLKAQGRQWPSCGSHGRTLQSCEGFWVCAGDDESHDVGVVGRLSAAAEA